MFSRCATASFEQAIALGPDIDRPNISVACGGSNFAVDSDYYMVTTSDAVKYDLRRLK